MPPGPGRCPLRWSANPRSGPRHCPSPWIANRRLPSGAGPAPRRRDAMRAAPIRRALAADATARAARRTCVVALVWNDQVRGGCAQHLRRRLRRGRVRQRPTIRAARSAATLTAVYGCGVPLAGSKTNMRCGSWCRGASPASWSVYTSMRATSARDHSPAAQPRRPRGPSGPHGRRHLCYAPSCTSMISSATSPCASRCTRSAASMLGARHR